MWLNIRAGLGPTRPKEDTTWFRVGLSHCFYTLGWYDTAQNFFGLSGPNPFDTKHDILSRAGSADPIPSTTPSHLGGRSECSYSTVLPLAYRLRHCNVNKILKRSSFLLAASYYGFKQNDQSTNDHGRIFY
jgi:hypothetical protein